MAQAALRVTALPITRAMGQEPTVIAEQRGPGFLSGVESLQLCKARILCEQLLPLKANQPKGKNKTHMLGTCHFQTDGANHHI